jgi:tRNA A-37 threonylcarbamoyl transferase component Bud32
VTVDPKDTRSQLLTRFFNWPPAWLARNLWVWPLLGALLISLVGLWGHSRVEGAMKDELRSHLQTVLDADVAALRLWFSEKGFDAQAFATERHIQAAIQDLAVLGLQAELTLADLDAAEATRTLHVYLEPQLEGQHYLDYVVVGSNKRVLASTLRFLVGATAPRGFDLFVEKCLRGEVAVSRPFAWPAPAGSRAGGPSMFVAAPVKAPNGTVVAVLGLRMKPQDEFSRIFSVARIGRTGETYAFDRRGVMLTDSRFGGQLKLIGLVPKGKDSTPILTLRLLDPGVDLVRGETPVKGRGDLPLTRMAAAAVTGEDGCDMDGYRDYRGVRVVGAWAWLPELGMGVATEVTVEEAFQTLNTLRRVFFVLFLLLVLSGIAILGFTLLVERLQASARRSALAARRLGQYVLVEEIGRGTDSRVYRARHTLLRRPVAIKLLSPEVTNEDSAARFEHEVQMTSQLTHPNTVAVFDYGRTPEGLFYYAMEYLSGIDLNRLVRQFGPQCEGRVIHILRQVCGSLAEAHGVGLIHRDIKPANIVLTRRGGLCDVVKVLDFGLVKAVAHPPTRGTTATAVVGTPHFMSPEAIDRPAKADSRSDLYSLGAVAYWLLAGQPLFQDDDVDKLLRAQVSNEPPPPSKRLGRQLDSDLERLVMQCLAKSPDQRPASAAALDQALAGCAAASAWTIVEAEAWWHQHKSNLQAAPKVAMAEKTLVIAPRG